MASARAVAPSVLLCVPTHHLPRLLQKTLAYIVGTTRSRVNVSMNQFRRLGLIEYNGGVKVHSARLSAVLHNEPRR